MTETSSRQRAAVAGAVARALATPAEPLSAGEREILSRYTWESYFSRLLRYIDE